MTSYKDHICDKVGPSMNHVTHSVGFKLLLYSRRIIEYEGDYLGLAEHNVTLSLNNVRNRII